MWERILQWDRDTFVYFNQLGIEKYDILWSVITDFNSWTPFFLFILYLFFTKFTRRRAWAMFGTVLLLALIITLMTNFTKELVARTRPNNHEELNTFIRVLRTPTNYSFFSGHAASSFAITTLVYLFLRKTLKWAVVLYIWPLLFSLSRIYVGVHYPLDIIAGMLVGVAVAIIFYFVYKKFIVPYLRLDHP